MRAVKKSQPKHPKSALKSLDFSRALKSFMGYLEGTQKAAHTIKNYRLDLLAFHSFLENQASQSAQSTKKPIRCETLGEKELNAYHEFLQAQGFKTNTRRRKLLTAHRFVRYLSQRNQLLIEAPNKLPAPHKVERVPFTVSQKALIDAVRALPVTSVLERRNRALLWVLAETGCQVSEIIQLRFEHWIRSGSHSQVTIPGKASRTLPVSTDLLSEIEELKASSHGRTAAVFLGFNKHGPLGAPISARGVELLVRFYSSRLNIPELTPRTFRHSAVIGWFEQGITQDEIQKRLGLRTAYAFRAYAPLLKSSSSATSTS
jgi:site-specific recombinase XerD